MSIADAWRHHADRLALEAPLNAVLVRAFADDWEAGGPLRAVLAGYQDAPRGDAVHLRLLAAVHRLVLSRQAPELATWYRSVGGSAAANSGPLAATAVAVVAAHAEQVRAGLALPPQTNEPGRAVALAVGLGVAAARAGLSRVRVLEIGASAGLNLNVADFRIEGEGFAWGPPDSPVRLLDAVRGAVPPSAPVRVVGRRGCDLDPVDAGTTEGRLWLTSFVWPDQSVRHQRLAGALEVARRRPVRVDRAPAAGWLRERLLGDPVDAGVLTVVWQSIMRQYLTAAQEAEIARVLADGRERAPVAHVALEPVGDSFRVPSLLLDGEVLGRSPAHGVPLEFG